MSFISVFQVKTNIQLHVILLGWLLPGKPQGVLVRDTEEDSHWNWLDLACETSD